MTDELDELYQEVILDHNRSPKNWGKPAGADRRADGYNPLCGDRLTVYARVADGRVAEIGFEGAGCAISKASASVMTAAVKGRTVEEARALFDRFHAMLTEDGAAPPEGAGDVAVFSGVREFPVRVKCATLAWHTMKSAVEGGGAVSTE